MNEQALWAYLCKKHPKFKTDGAHFTPQGLWKFYNTVWKCAEKSVFEAAGIGRADTPDVVKDLFGMLGVKR